MNTSDFLEFLLGSLQSICLSEELLRWVVLGITCIGLLFSGGVVGWALNLFKFRKRAFFDQMVIGVNILEQVSDGRWMLHLRTLVENNLDAIIDNPVLERMVRRAAKKCTEERPILELKDSEDHALLLTKIQNAISSVFAGEHILRMLGRPCKAQWAEFVVTCERYGGLKATKIRVLVFVKEDIKRLLDDRFYKGVITEVPHHRDRLRTLKLIAANHLNDKDTVRGSVEIPMSPK